MMNEIKIVTDQDIGQGLQIEADKLNIKVDNATIMVNEKGEIQTATLELEDFLTGTPDEYNEDGTRIKNERGFVVNMLDIATLEKGGMSSSIKANGLKRIKGTNLLVLDVDPNSITEKMAEMEATIAEQNEIREVNSVLLNPNAMKFSVAEGFDLCALLKSDQKDDNAMVPMRLQVNFPTETPFKHLTESKFFEGLTFYALDVGYPQTLGDSDTVNVTADTAFSLPIKYFQERDNRYSVLLQYKYNRKTVSWNAGEIMPAFRCE